MNASEKEKVYSSSFKTTEMGIRFRTCKAGNLNQSFAFTWSFLYKGYLYMAMSITVFFNLEATSRENALAYIIKRLTSSHNVRPEN